MTGTASPLENHESSCNRIPFLELSRFLEACANAVKQPVKAEKLVMFRNRNIEPIRAIADDLFQVYRLLCPDKDSRRYSIKEAMLARRMGAACESMRSGRDSVTNVPFA